MTLEEAAVRVDTAMAHAWMVRTFLKHAEEIAENDAFLEVPRTIFDCIRAVEPARQRGDLPEFFHRLRGKLSKLKKAATFFAENYRSVTDHTNWQMAALSLSGVVAQLEEIVAQVPRGVPVVKAESVAVRPHPPASSPKGEGEQDRDINVSGDINASASSPAPPPL